MAHEEGEGRVAQVDVGASVIEAGKQIQFFAKNIITLKHKLC